MRISSDIRVGAIAVVCVALVLAFTSSYNDAPTIDEIPHIGAGFSYVTQFEYRLNPEHPPLIKDLAGLALLPLEIPPSVLQLPAWTSAVNGEWDFGRSVIFDSGVSPDLITMVARLPMLGIFVLACWLMWRWASERYGTTAALLALILFAFSPTILAHARFVTTDVGAALGVLLATYFFVAFLRKPNQRTFWVASLTLGLALLIKFSTALLGPFFILIAIIYGLSGQWTRTAWNRAFRATSLTILVGAAAFVCVVLPWYTLHTWNESPSQQRADTQALTADHPSSLQKTAVIWMSDKPVIRAAGKWFLGLTMTAQRAQGGNTIYWMGRVVTTGGPWYFPLIYLFKEPLAWWLLAVIAISTLSFRRHKNWFATHTEEWVWSLWLLIYWGVSINSPLNIGVRHLLPVYPFAILLVSGRLAVLLKWLRTHDRTRLRIVAIVITLLMSWYVFDSVRVWPSYLSYFNQIAGGPTGGHNFVTDSNLDWGQDLKRLGQWVEQNNIQKISLDYFGWADPAYYLHDRSVYTTAGYWKDSADFIRRNTTNGWIAVSATYFQQAVYDTNQNNGGYRWLLNYTPVTVIGNSIFVWHVTK